MKKEWILEGLNCANCSTKIEKEVNGIPGVEAQLNFMTKTLSVTTDEDIQKIHDKIVKIVHKHEPEVSVREKEDTHVHEHIGERDFKKEKLRLLISGVLFALGIILNLPKSLSLAIFLISYLIIGGDILSQAGKNIVKGLVFDENFLMTIATIGAFIVGEYAEGVAVMLFYQLGELFQDIAVHKSRKSIAELMDIKVEYVSRLIDGVVEEVKPEEVNIGDKIVVKPGEKIPLDGVVLEGNSSVDTSALTGESLPIDVEKGSNVLSGTINKNGLLTIQVTKAFKDSTVTKIIDLVQNASSKKAPTEKFITKFARYYTPFVVISALFIALIPPLFISGAQVSDWAYRALIFLVISCPCALVVSIPLGFFGGIGGASQKGILVKGGNYLEALNHVDTVVFDKTGTLTKGIFKVTGIYPQEGISPEELLEYAAYAESFSNHPIAQSIMQAYGSEVNISQVESVKELPGRGIKIFYKGKEVLAGNRKLLAEHGVFINNDIVGATVVYIVVNGEYIGYILISDEIKEDAKDTIRSLKGLGVKNTIMLSGDNESAARLVGEKIGLDQIYAELLPTDKVEKLESIHAKLPPKKKLIYVGDGINDAPVLARADIGIAMGSLGSDAAIEAADIVIMNDEISKISTALKIARRTNKIVWQNVAFALGIKFIFLIFGAFGIATMWEAVFADVGVSILAVLNSIRAMNVNKI